MRIGIGYRSFLNFLILPALSIVAGPVGAQQDSSGFLPVVNQKHAGTYHVATDTWTRGSASTSRAWNDVLFDNTCLVGFYGPTASTQRIVDDGRIPSTTSPTNPGPPYTVVSWTGTQDSYQVNGFELGYCSFGPPVDLQINFWECFTGCQDATLIHPEATFNLRGMPAAGACWTMAIDLGNSDAPFVMNADCDGAWNGGGAADTFGWSFQQLSPSTAGAGGCYLAGDPAGYMNGGPGGTGCEMGANTAFYAGSSPTSAGSGLSGTDTWEVDSMTPPPSYLACYWYGGYSNGAPYGSFYMKVLGETTSPGIRPGAQYCYGDGVALPCPCGNDNDGSHSGCDWIGGNVAGGALRAIGSNVSINNDAFLHATNVSGDSGVFFSANGEVTGRTLGDGLRCAGHGLIRMTPPIASGGSTASHAIPLQTLDPLVGSGITRYYQYWFRTPNGPCGSGVNTTNGYQITWTP